MRAITPVLVLLLLAGAAGADELPYPPGMSSHPIEGLQVELVLPQDLSAREPASLFIVLHGAGGTATGMAGRFRNLASDGYVVCAPKSKGQTWAKSDLDAVLRIALHLIEVLPIDKEKIHTAGFSNGGWNLHPIAFADELKPVSATWIAAGFRGGSVPKWAKGRLGALALAGAQDGNADAARATVPALMAKARSAEVRIQPNLGHKMPVDLLPYMEWWMGVMEGRFAPGDDKNFEWGDSLPDALATLKGKKRGGAFVYVYDADAKDDALTKTLQGLTFMDPRVRHYGNQLQAVKLDKAQAAEQLAPYGVKLDKLPLVVVFPRTAKSKKVLAGKIKARKLVSALRKVAPDKADPFK